MMHVNWSFLSFAILCFLFSRCVCETVSPSCLLLLLFLLLLFAFQDCPLNLIGASCTKGGGGGSGGGAVVL